jgi:hypothetical protein
MIIEKVINKYIIHYVNYETSNNSQLFDILFSKNILNGSRWKLVFDRRGQSGSVLLLQAYIVYNNEPKVDLWGTPAK